ncbi:MAG: efflux RND transporter periplasmic adaptor subunit [Verrucomicrobia bacterium]|nr:efflux RND transporter periplasmic adaptor subunit [Verrucomicrobiota bacterium]
MASSPKKPLTLKSILRLVIIAGILGAVGWGGRALWKQIGPGLFGTKREAKIPTAAVKVANISEEIVAVGRLRAVFSTELRAEIGGRIMKISVIDGEAVKRDQEILRLDQQDILTQIQESDRNIEASKLKVARAKREFERQKDLKTRELITAKDFEETRTALSLTENDAAVYDARAANLRDKLAKTVIRAPHDGTLLLRDLTEGQLVTSAAATNGGTLLGEVADLSALMVRTNINEIDVARLKVSDVARVRVDSLRNMMLNGEIKRIATVATESLGDRTRVFPVDVVVDETDPRLRPGMSATVMFTLAHVENVPAVPLSAVFSNADSVRYVFVNQGETFEVRGIDIGLVDTRRVQIISGLSNGELVALMRPLEFTGEIPIAKPTAPLKARSKRSSLP